VFYRRYFAGALILRIQMTLWPVWLLIFNLLWLVKLFLVQTWQRFSTVHRRPFLLIAAPFLLLWSSIKCHWSTIYRMAFSNGVRVYLGDSIGNRNHIFFGLFFRDNIFSLICIFLTLVTFAMTTRPEYQHYSCPSGTSLIPWFEPTFAPLPMVIGP